MHLLFFLRWFSFGRNLNFHLGIKSCLIYFPLVVRENLWQFVRYGHVKLVEGTSLEESAGALQRLEIIESVDIEEVPVGVGVRKVVAGDVGDGGQSLIDVILAGVVDDVLSNFLLVTKYSLVILESC